MIATSVMAQLVTPPSSILQQANIGLVDEFMKRFNGEEVHPELSSKGEDNRRENLICLFNFEQFAGRGDSIKSEIENLISTVISDSISVDYSDSKWFAQALCQGTLDGKETTFTVYLIVEERGEDMYKWVISSVEGKIFDISPKVNNEAIMLYPDDHETKFISLSRMTKEQPANVELFMNKDFRYDPTSVFTYLVYTNRLKIDFVKNLEFVFAQVPGYMFSIRYFHRETSNSGWLITDLWRADDDTKTEYLQSLNITASFEYEKKDYDEGNKINDILIVSTELPLRTKEYISLLNEYTACITSESDVLESSDFYKEKLSKLFAPNSCVQVKKGDDYREVELDEFCKKYLMNSEITISLDSLQIPVPLPQEIEPVTDNDILLVPSMIVNLRNDSCNHINEEKQLWYYKEYTEDGEEWIPIFGDLYVSIKNKDDD